MTCRQASSAICARFLLPIALCIPTAEGQETGVSPEPAALAESYQNDRGIAHDPAVIFSDDFEAWANNGTTPPANTWQVRQNSVSRTHVIAGQIQSDAYSGPGARVLEIACWTEGNGSQTGGLSLKLGNLKHIPVHVGRWYCVERHLKLNSVDPSHPDAAIADGVEELWIDGQVSIQKRDVRFRRVPHLKITLLSLETYYHGLPEQYRREHPIRVCFDNVVVARQYIGPLTVGSRRHLG
jgi:hypothetical protein